MTLADCFLLQVLVFLKGSLPDRGIHQEGCLGGESVADVSVWQSLSVSGTTIHLPEAIAFEENICLSGIALSWVT